jgi:siderophore synthetase component
LAVYRGGQIVRFLARDFDGLDIHQATLEARGYTLDLYPGSIIFKEKIHTRYNLLDTVYQLHLGEIVISLAAHFNCEENIFWQVIKTVTQERFRALQAEMDEEVWQMEYHAILEADWSSRAMLRMRLQKKHAPEGLFFNVVNPLR